MTLSCHPFQIAVFQSEQLDVSLTKKETELEAAKKQITRIENDKAALITEIQNMKRGIERLNEELLEKKVQIIAVNKALSMNEKALAEMAKELENTQKERNIIATQLARRLDEIDLLNERIQLLRITVERNETHYQNRLEDIRLLKIEIQNVRSQRGLLAMGLANTADMRHEVLQLHRDLLQERVKSKVLERLTSSPTNVHRWRQLKGRDPERAELIEKNRFLQKFVQVDNLI